MIVIGLTGKAGAGKSTVADYLVEKHGFTKLSFAGPLKKMLRTLDPIIFNAGGGDCRLSELLQDYTEADLKTYYPEYRRLLQVLGTDCIRAEDEDFWVRAAMKQLTNLSGRYVFDDVRFPNEADSILNCSRRGNMALWNVWRPDHEPTTADHSSEQHAGDMGETCRIWNGGPLEELHAKADYGLRLLGFPIPDTQGAAA